MSSCRLGRRPVDLLHEVADLHEYVERELHGIAVAISDLDDFFFAVSQPSKNVKKSLESDQTAARALAGRRLHSILSRGRKRILSALARQRTLLWEFSGVDSWIVDTEPTTAAATAAETEKQRDRKKERTARGSSLVQVKPHHHQHQQPNGATATTAVEAAAGDGNKNDGSRGNINDGDWKRHTLFGMHRLLSRKASEPTATATARATIIRDMTKIAAALQQLGVQTTAAAAAPAPLASDDGVPVPRPSSETPPTGIPPSAPPADNFSSTRAQKTLQRGEDQGCNGRSTTSSSSCSERAADRQSEGIDGGNYFNPHPLISSSSSSSNSNSIDALLLLHQQLRLPDGIDALLKRISEGVRPRSRNLAPPPAPPDNNGGSVAGVVAMPPCIAPDNAGRGTRQEPTCSEKIERGARQGSTCGLSAPGCSIPRVGVRAARDERDMPCAGQEISRRVGGLGGGGRGGVGGMAKARREVSKIAGLSAACCVRGEGGRVSQRPTRVGEIEREEAMGGGGKGGSPSNALIERAKAVGRGGKDGGAPNALIEREEVVGEGGEDGSPSALKPSVNQGFSRPGLPCSNVVTLASPKGSKGFSRGGVLDGNSSDNKENRRV